MLDRRRFLGSLAATAALCALARPGRSLAQDAGRKRFLFINAEGGWDPLCVFAPLFGREGIDMEPDAAQLTLGDQTIVDHPLRPSVRAFFEAHGGQTVVLNGVSTRSVNHETCQAVAMTGATSDAGTDWATRLADAERGAYRLPHLVISGPAFAGESGVIVSRAQGALQSLIDGSLLVDSDTPVEPPIASTQGVVDRYLSRRASGFAKAFPDRTRRVAYVEAVRRSQGLISDRLEISLRSGASLDARLGTAVSALASGLSRCASVGTDFVFDTHADNSQQTGLFQAFFVSLADLMQRLANTPGPEGQPLAKDTVVVVSSEMGRTPAYNATQGRDHWPFTSMLLIGPGLTGGRVIGGFSDRYGGLGVVPQSGALDPAIPGIAATDVGATLLALGGLDPAERLPTATPIRGILS